MLKNKKFLLTLTTPIILFVLIFSSISLTSKLKPKDDQATPAAVTESNAVSNHPIDNEVRETYAAYIIKKGDTLYNISKEYFPEYPYSVVAKTIAKANNLTDVSALAVGTTLSIPTEYFESGEIYTIQKGDTLFSIAKSFLGDTNVKAHVEKIMADNFLESSAINIGDELFITTESLTK